jgi:creatinine amidohydrolase
LIDWRSGCRYSSQTLYRIVADVAQSLTRSGVAHLVLINGHGGNYVLSNVVKEYTAANGPTMSLYPQSHDRTKARQDAGMEADNHEDMHAGEMETCRLLHVAPHLVRDGNENADWLADDRPHLLTLGMAAHTTSGGIGRPSLVPARRARRHWKASLTPSPTTSAPTASRSLRARSSPASGGVVSGFRKPYLAVSGTLIVLVAVVYVVIQVVLVIVCFACSFVCGTFCLLPMIFGQGDQCMQDGPSRPPATAQRSARRPRMLRASRQPASRITPIPRGLHRRTGRPH